MKDPTNSDCGNTGLYVCVMHSDAAIHNRKLKKEFIEELRALARKERHPFDPLWEPEARRLMLRAADSLESANATMNSLIEERNQRGNK